MVTTTTTAVASTGNNRPTSFYRRALKPPCIAFSSADGRRLFREALIEGHMESYFRLAEQFRTQDDPTFCGLSTLTMVLNALAVDPGRIWKGPWRWYHESMLDCCAPLDTVRTKGITLLTLGCVARCNGLKVDMAGPDTHTLQDLRAVIEECSFEDCGKVVVASYDRRGLKQTGSGHFSPIGGYHKAEDLVLILDTARFKLPPHWVPLSTLWEAMKTLDPETGKPRGYMVLEKKHSLSHRVFTANSGNYEDWPQVASWLNEIITLATAEEKGEPSLREATTVAEFVPLLLERLPPVVKDLLTMFTPTGDPTAASGQVQDGVVLQALQGTEAYREVTRIDRYNIDRSNSSSNSSSSSGSGSNKNGSGGGSKSSGTNEHPGDAPNNCAVETPSPTSVCQATRICECSSRHVISMITYALLVMLHTRDGGGGDVADDEASGRDKPVWHKDPLVALPITVADEAVHVATMLGGLMEMEECKKNAP